MLSRVRQILKDRAESRKGDKSGRLTFELQRRYAVMLLAGCTGDQSFRVRARLLATSSSAELWQLRSAVFECIAHGCSEREAIERLGSLDLCISGSPST